MGNGAPNEIVVSTWHNGPNIHGSTVLQDELAILAGSPNNLGYRIDDHGDSISTPTALSFDGSVWSGAGIIETNDDVDVFDFSCRGCR